MVEATLQGGPMDGQRVRLAVNHPPSELDFSPEGPAPIDLSDLNPPELVQATYRYDRSYIQERPRARVHRYVLQEDT
jgi:hypothetical protein